MAEDLVMQALLDVTLASEEMMRLRGEDIGKALPELETMINAPGTSRAVRNVSAFR